MMCLYNVVGLVRKCASRRRSAGTATSSASYDIGTSGSGAHD